MMRRFVLLVLSLAPVIPIFSETAAPPQAIVTGGPAQPARVEARPAKIEIPPQIITGTWSTTQCRRDTGTMAGTFTIAVSDKRKLDGIFLDTSNGETTRFVGRITRKGIVRGRLRQGRMVRGVATGTTNVEIHGVFFGRCVGVFDSAPVENPQE